MKPGSHHEPGFFVRALRLHGRCAMLSLRALHIPFPSKLFTKTANVLSFLLKLRTRAQQLFRLSDAHTMLIWAVVVGVAGALATTVFREGIALTQRLLGNHSEGLVA